jgi:hypothetical protein
MGKKMPSTKDIQPLLQQKSEPLSSTKTDYATPLIDTLFNTLNTKKDNPVLLLSTLNPVHQNALIPATQTETIRTELTSIALQHYTIVYIPDFAQIANNAIRSLAKASSTIVESIKQLTAGALQIGDTVSITLPDAQTVTLQLLPNNAAKVIMPTWLLTQHQQLLLPQAQTSQALIPFEPSVIFTLPIEQTMVVAQEKKMIAMNLDVGKKIFEYILRQNEIQTNILEVKKTVLEQRRQTTTKNKMAPSTPVFSGKPFIPPFKQSQIPPTPSSTMPSATPIRSPYLPSGNPASLNLRIPTGGFGGSSVPVKSPLSPRFFTNLPK